MPPPPGGFLPGAAAGPRPKEVDLSFWLWVTSFVLGVIGLLVSAVELLFALFMRKGRNWARILLTVFGVIAVVSGLYSLTTESGVQLALTVISLPVVIGAIVTMFLPAANPWFRPRPTAG